MLQSWNFMMATRMKIVILLFFVGVSCQNHKMKEVYKWKKIDFKYAADNFRQEAIDSNNFIPENNLPLGLDVWRHKLFVTLPRWKMGVPATLAYIDLDDNSTSPKLIPYPDLETNRIPVREGTSLSSLEPSIISTFRIRVDPCDRLWVMDTGVVDILGEHNRVSNQKILIFDLKTNTLIRQYELKPSDKKENSFFANIIVDVEKDNCDSAFAYIPDLGGYGVVVYSFKGDESWRIEHNYFYFDPLQGDLTVGGVNFQWNDGIFSIALSPKQEDGFRTAYFHSLASTKLFSVSTKYLQNQTLAAKNFHEFKYLGSRGPNSQATASFLDPKTGILFYTQLIKNGVGCWNTSKPFTIDNLGLVTTDDTTFIFPNDLKVDYDGKLWVLTDRLPSFMYGSLNYTDVNFRIFSTTVEEAIKDTPCA